MPSHLAFSLYYLVSFLFLAFSVSLLPIYCLHLGFTPTDIALLSAATTFTSAIAPIAFQQLAFKYIAPRRLFSWSSYLAFLVLVIGLTCSTIGVFVLAWAVLTLFFRGAATLSETQALRDSVKIGFGIEKIRVWGSIGFVVGTQLGGTIIDNFSESSLSYLGLAFMSLLVLTTPLMKPLLKEISGSESQITSTDTNSPASTQQRFAFVLLLAVCFLLWASQSVYYVFFSVFLKDLSWTGTQISLAWNVGVVAEILFFIYAPRLSSNVSLARLLELSIVFNTIRLFILSQTTNMQLIMFSQCLHIFSFATMFLSSVKLAYFLLPDNWRDRGQGLLALAGGTGSLCGRLLLIPLATPNNIPNLFFIFSIISLSAFPLSRAISATVKNNQEDQRK